MFENIFDGKTCVVTGHTGFKGSWLSLWLLSLGARVVGISNESLGCDSLFEQLKLENNMHHHLVDTRDYRALEFVLHSEKPDFVFHLAAQALVSVAYESPLETFSSNALGTANVLEALRGIDSDVVAIMITSDKSYDNVEWAWGYRETDALGGKDIYSGSKAAAEAIIRSYCQSYFTHEHGRNIKIGVARAGNVIGGGDWARDRIVVDVVKSWARGTPVGVRSPSATRPWQHVLEPLSGYMTLAWRLANGEVETGEAYNFGPRAEQNRTVLDLICDMASSWSGPIPDPCYEILGEVPFKEASLLKLNCDKALLDLGWTPNLDYAQTVSMTSEWYSNLITRKAQLKPFTLSQLDFYQEQAKSDDKVWAAQ